MCLPMRLCAVARADGRVASGLPARRFSDRLGLVLALRNTYVEQPFFCDAVRQVRVALMPR